MGFRAWPARTFRIPGIRRRPDQRSIPAEDTASPRGRPRGGHPRHQRQEDTPYWRIPLPRRGRRAALGRGRGGGVWHLEAVALASLRRGEDRPVAEHFPGGRMEALVVRRMSEQGPVRIPKNVLDEPESVRRYTARKSWTYRPCAT